MTDSMGSILAGGGCFDWTLEWCCHSSSHPSWILINTGDSTFVV